MEIAPALTDHLGAKLKVVIILGAEMTKREGDDRVSQVRTMMAENDLPADLAVVKEREILQGLVGLSKGAGLFLMGGKTGDFMELLLAKSLTREISERVHCPVLWVKEYEERESFWHALIKQITVKGGPRHG